MGKAGHVIYQPIKENGFKGQFCKPKVLNFTRKGVKRDVKAKRSNSISSIIRT